MRMHAGLVAVALLLGATPGLRPQAAVEIQDDDGVLAMKERIFAFVLALIDFTTEARLGEPELEAILTHYATLQEIHGGEGPGGVVERAFLGGRYDFRIMVNDPSYASWCEARGLEPEPFFRGLLRLEALRMREEGLAGLERAREDLPAQREELESMRERVGEEAYREGVAALEAAAEMVEETRELMSGLPRPSPDEVRLLRENRGRIQQVLGRGGPE